MTKNLKSFKELVGAFYDCSSERDMYDNVANKVVEFKNKFYSNCNIFWNDHSVAQAAQRDHQTIMNMARRDISRIIAGDASLSEMAANVIANNLENKIIELYYNEEDSEKNFSEHEFDKPEATDVREWYDTNILPLFFTKYYRETLSKEYIKNNYQITW